MFSKTFINMPTYRQRDKEMIHSKGIEKRSYYESLRNLIKIL